MLFELFLIAAAIFFVVCFVNSGGSYSAFFAVIAPFFWLLGKVIQHPPIWRKMTAKSDYGRMGRHWGGYSGFPKSECFLCGQVRYEREGRWEEDPNNRGKHIIKEENVNV